MEIKVGSKYHSNKKEVKILMIVENEVIVKVKEGNVVAYNIDYFKEIFKPINEFKWSKHFFGAGMVRDLEVELLLNYKRYHEQCDNVKFEDYDNRILYYITKQGYIETGALHFLGKLDTIFSTKENAETFLKLAKENDCL